MSVVPSMLVIEPQNPAIVAGKNPMIDIGQIISGNAAPLIHPYFTAQLAVAPLF